MSKEKPSPDFADTAVDLLPPHAGARGIEIQYRLEGRGPRDETMLEIWTMNRIYRVDATMTCFAVLDRETGKLDATTKLVGSILSGGQARPDEDVVDIFYPFPVPGSAAFFKERDSVRVVGRTSLVERVVLCVHKMRLRHGGVDVHADMFTGRFGAR
jgi:hypothetical protein